QYAQTEGYADPMLATLRPDWIFEILGLEPLPEPDGPGVEVTPDESSATITVTERRRLDGGAEMVKESVVSVVEQRVVEHRLYTEGRGELIARARVDQPQRVAVGPANGPEPPATMELPRLVQLTIPQVAELTMTL